MLFTLLSQNSHFIQPILQCPEDFWCIFTAFKHTAVQEQLKFFKFPKVVLQFKLKRALGLRLKELNWLSDQLDCNMQFGLELDTLS